MACYITLRAASFLLMAVSLSAEENLVVNGTMEAGTTQPDGWSLWNGGGSIGLTRPTVDKGPVLRLQSSADGNGSASAPLAQLAPRLRVRARLRGEGTPTDCQLALQCFDAAGTQVGWIWLATPTTTWAQVDTTAEPPREATGAKLVLVLHGAGAVELDDVLVDRTKR